MKTTAAIDRDDFIIEKSEKNDKLINVAGIESPGLSSAPAIALYVKDIVLGQKNNGPIYDIMGRKVTNLESGKIYIQNGHKFVK